MPNKKLKITKPIARNSSAHKALHNHFIRISSTLEDKVSEFLKMKKYTRVYEESLELLEIKKTIDMAAGRIFEVHFKNKLNTKLLNQLMQLLNNKNTAIKSYIQGKPVTLQIKLLHEISKNINKIVINITQITRDVDRLNDIIPVIKALLKTKDIEEDHERDPLLLEITKALKINVTEPSLTNIKIVLQKHQIDVETYDQRLHFEHFNDVSDKLIGLLNDKLLLVLNISEMLVTEALDEEEDIHDVPANQRLPDELRVLFLAMSTLDILHKIQEMRDSVKVVLSSTRFYLQIFDSGKLESRVKCILNTGNHNVHELTLQTAKVIQKFELFINELVAKIDPLKISKSIKLSHSLIYEKSHKIWENPYKI